MTFTQELHEIRTIRKAKSANERAAQGTLEYRDGYAAGYTDYIGFREPMDGVGELAALTEKHVAGYRAGYSDARRGRENHFHGHGDRSSFLVHEGPFGLMPCATLAGKKVATVLLHYKPGLQNSDAAKAA